MITQVVDLPRGLDMAKEEKASGFLYERGRQLRMQDGGIPGRSN